MKAKLLDDTELTVKGIEALNKSLGPVEAYRFLALLHREQTDYVKISRELYKGQTVAEVFARAKKNWKG